jgi:hypothetical protein
MTPFIRTDYTLFLFHMGNNPTDLILTVPSILMGICTLGDLYDAV